MRSFKLHLETYGGNKFQHFNTTCFLASFCNSDSYKYHDYKYNEYNYDQNYDYDNQKPEDYTEAYSQELNEYYDQNLLLMQTGVVIILIIVYKCINKFILGLWKIDVALQSLFIHKISPTFGLCK